MRFLPVLASLGLLLGLGVASAGPDSVGRLPLLTRAKDVRNLLPGEAMRNYPVHLRAVVTFVDRGPGEVFVQDETAGVFVFEHDSVTDAPLRPGQLVDLTGFTTPADFAPAVTKAHFKVLGAGPLPKPRRRPFEEVVDGKEDGQWFELDGIVRSGQIKGVRLFLNVATEGGSFVAVMPEFPPDWKQKLVDARVTFRGVLAAVFNEHRQSSGVRMFVPGSDFVRIDETAPPDVFRLSESSAVSVGRFHPLEQLSRRIRARATVAALEPGIAMYVIDRTGSLEVQPIPGCAAQPGELVDVVGFPGVIEGRPGLLDSLCRKIGPGFAIDAISVQAQQVIPPQVHTDPSGYGFAAGTRFDGRLIRLEAILLGSSYHPEAATFLARSGERDFTASLPAFADQKFPQLQAGSRLRFTGLCLVTFDPYHRAQFFRILLRSPGDIVILARPSWWTFQHSIWSLCLLAAACLSAAAWISVLRHQVAVQTQQLRLANERLTELSTRDSLTHAFNRRHFDQTLASELQRTLRSGRPLSLIMADLDHFKSLNDIYGHQKGDDCLIRVVRALQSSVQRHADLVARYGGEEFAVILPETDRDGALRIAESMRAAVASLAMPHPGSPAFGFVTVSAGVTTTCPPGEICASGIIEIADRALYEAKHMGRNRVVYMDASLPSPQPQANEEVAAHGTPPVVGLDRFRQ